MGFVVFFALCRSCKTTSGSFYAVLQSFVPTFNYLEESKMKKINSLKTFLKKFTPAALGVSAVLASGMASAADLSGAISTATGDATANVELVATGLIAIAAVMMGVGIVVSALRR